MVHLVDSNLRDIHCFVDFNQNYRKKMFSMIFPKIRCLQLQYSNLFFSVNFETERFDNVSNNSL